MEVGVFWGGDGRGVKIQRSCIYNVFGEARCRTG